LNIFFLASFTSMSCTSTSQDGRDTANQPTNKLQALFVDKQSSDEQLQDAFNAIRKYPPEEDARIWIQILRDASQSPLSRQLAFRAFAERFIRPNEDLGAVARKYGIVDWFSDSNLLEWTYSSATPLDKITRDLELPDGIYAVPAPKDVQPPRGGLYFCFALPQRMNTDEIRERIRTHRPLRITHIVVPGPDDDL